MRAQQRKDEVKKLLKIFARKNREASMRRISHSQMKMQLIQQINDEPAALRKAEGKMFSILLAEHRKQCFIDCRVDEAIFMSLTAARLPSPSLSPLPRRRFPAVVSVVSFGCDKVFRLGCSALITSVRGGGDGGGEEEEVDRGVEGKF